MAQGGAELSNRTFVIGVGMTKFEKPGTKEGDYPDWAVEAGEKALADAGISYEDVEQAYAGYCYGDSTYGQRALYGLGLTGIPVINVNNNCSTGSSALFLARQAVKGGLVDCALAVGFETIEAVAGGETAGIPFAAWIADRLGAPMAYVRKQAKGFGRNALIEGDVPEGKRTLLVEDLTTDGQSKIRFAQSLRDAGAIVNHTFVVFYYGVFPGSFEQLAGMDIALHHLCTWWDVLDACKDRPYFSDAALSEVRRFLENPVAWSAAHGGISSAEEAMARKAAAEG